MTSASPERFHVEYPPIVEAIIGIDCDLPPTFDLSSVEDKALDSLRADYPNLQKKTTKNVKLESKGQEEITQSVTEGLEALMFRSEDGKQLAQFRKSGYSFNRLAPYGDLDEYIVDINATWEIFREICEPIQLRRISLRTINRIKLPLEDGGGVKLDDYLNTGPRLPKPEGRVLQFGNFLNQHQIIDTTTGHHVNIVLATQEVKDGKLTLLLDTDAFSFNVDNVGKWEEIELIIQSLRDLKNDLFKNILTDKCLNLFSNPQ